MGKIIDYIFKHQVYREVQNSYVEITGELKKAFRIWCISSRYKLSDSYKDKQFIHKNITDIRQLNRWMNLVDPLITSKKEAVLWILCYPASYTGSPALSYSAYQYLAERTSEIDRLQKIYESSCLIISSYGDAVSKFLNNYSGNYTYEERRRIVNNEENIKKIAKTLDAAIRIKNDYPEVWDIFCRNRTLNEISIEELKELIIPDTAFIKHKFLKVYKANPKQIDLLTGNRYNIKSFKKETISEEKEILDFIQDVDIALSPKHFNIHIEDEKQAIRAILNSEHYGNDCQFDVPFSLSDWYLFRSEFDKLDTCFDAAVSKIKENEAEVIKFNKERGLEAITYLQDYRKCIDPSTELYAYLQEYKKEKVKRLEARNLYSAYPDAFMEIWGQIDFDNCSFNIILDIIKSESSIIQKAQFIEEQYRQEHRRQKLDALKRKIEHLRNSIREGYLTRYFPLKCFSLYNYYPTTCDWEANEEEWTVRNLIWDFKANPHREEQLSETLAKHEEAVNKIIPLLKRCLKNFYGDAVSELTLVCIPSSKKIITERRYKDFANKICVELNMQNGYEYVKVDTDGEAAHLGGTSSASFSIHRTFFKDKYVILFDDVITTGRSMEKFRHSLENAGAHVIGGFSIGRTRRTRQSYNPIEVI